MSDSVPAIPLVSVARPTSIPPPFTPEQYVTGDACTLVIFGAAGDLARRKLFPAIYQLAKSRLLAEGFRVIGVGVEPLDDAQYRDLIKDALSRAEDVHDFDPHVWTPLASTMRWVKGDLTQPGVYAAVGDLLAREESRFAPKDQNRLFYLAVPPALFEPIVKNLAASKLVPKTPSDKARPWRRVILEKPFGRSLSTARELTKIALDAFAEPQIYRIDHYVGKETVQNVLVLRSANAIFESLWSREHITHVEITAAETVGLEGRARYYETAGVVRDMFQNHLLQLVALTAMEPPTVPTADAIRDEKVKVLRAIAPIVKNGRASAIRAQYTRGSLHGEPVAGYREEPGVAADSSTPTYAALRLEVQTDRWRGVPFYVRSGKRMHKRASEIAIHFKRPLQRMYEPCPDEVLAGNVLVLRLQPNDGISLSFAVKIPGAALALTPGIEIAPVEMDFAYASAFGSEVHPAYETLLLDCMIGDPTLFTRSDEVEAQWAIIDPLLEHWEGTKDPNLPTYPAGSWGPPQADAFLATDGFAWRTP